MNLDMLFSQEVPLPKPRPQEGVPLPRPRPTDDINNFDYIKKMMNSPRYAPLYDPNPKQPKGGVQHIIQTPNDFSMALDVVDPKSTFKDEPTVAQKWRSQDAKDERYMDRLYRPEIPPDHLLEGAVPPNVMSPPGGLESVLNALRNRNGFKI
jgi:hypothetical protein